MKMKQRLGIRLPNWLGDVIMTLPTLEALTLSGYQLELFGRAWIKDLFAAYDYNTHVLPKNFWQARHVYHQYNIEECILFTNSLSSALHVCLQNIKATGYGANGRYPFLYRCMEKKPDLHEVYYFWNLAQSAVNQDWAPPTPPQFKIDPQVQDEVDALLKSLHIFDDFWVVCPGAIGHGVGDSSKVWPFWQDLLIYLTQRGHKIIACPAPFEFKMFHEHFSKQVTFIPNLNIPQFAAVLKRAQQVIANDSGPMHLAAAVQAPVLGIFGRTDPRRTRPWGGEFVGDLHRWPSLEEVLLALNIQ